MIPKIIHYCWFGGNPKSELILKCIESWKKFAADYKIIEWNENNFDLNKYKYVRQAYDKGKFAFVSDVVRFDVLNKYGGVYLDTDVELLAPIDSFMNSSMFMGFDKRNKVASGLIFGSISNHPILADVLTYYDTTPFIMSNGNIDTTTVVTILSDVLTANGYVLDGKMIKDESLTVYPSEYFDPLDYENEKLTITKNTIAIHYYAGSWKSKKDRIIARIGLMMKKIIGKDLYEKVARLKHKHWG